MALVAMNDVRGQAETELYLLPSSPDPFPHHNVINFIKNKQHPYVQVFSNEVYGINYDDVDNDNDAWICHDDDINN